MQRKQEPNWHVELSELLSEFIPPNPSSVILRRNSLYVLGMGMAQW